MNTLAMENMSGDVMGFFDNMFDFLKDDDKSGYVKIIDGRIFVKCPNCGEWVDLKEERCPKCHKRLDTMFKKKCPKCGHLNPLRAEKCEKCGYDFALEEAQLEIIKEEAKQEQYYVCPICGYRSRTFMTRCPVCGTRFV